MSIGKLLRNVSLTATLTLLGSTMAFASVGEVIGSTVNVRSVAGTNGDVLGQVAEGEQYDIIGHEGEWYQISYNGSTGFVMSDYFAIYAADAVITGSLVNMRDMPSTDGAVVAQLPQNTGIKVTGKTGDWYAVAYDGQTGYIDHSFVAGALLSTMSGGQTATTEQVATSQVDLSNTYGVVTTSSALNVREEAHGLANVLTKLTNGTTVEILGIADDWIWITTDAGIMGFVSSDYLAIKTGTRPANSVATATAATTLASTGTKGQQVIAYAKNFIGTPYVWGGTNLNSGVDCSGFVYSVMKEFGVSLPRTSYDMAGVGTTVSKSDLQAGDLVFFNTGGNSRVSHVGIALGDGQYIHAATGSTNKVIISSLSTSYATNNYVYAKRVL